MKIVRALILTFFGLFSISTLFLSCGDYTSVEESNGRLAIIEQANMFLSGSLCDQAIDILKPLYWSKYVDVDTRMTLASAYACKSGFSLAKVVGKLKNFTGNFYDTMVAAMYSTGSDSHLTNYQQAATYIRETTTDSSTMAASARPSDSNVYMIFMQLGALSSVLSVLGQADQSTGAKTVALSTTTPTAAQDCAAQIAFATIKDCLSYIGSASVFSSMTTQINKVCTGTVCNNVDPSACSSSATLQAAGLTILLAIDTQW